MQENSMFRTGRKFHGSTVGSAIRLRQLHPPWLNQQMTAGGLEFRHHFGQVWHRQPQVGRKSAPRKKRKPFQRNSQTTVGIQDNPMKTHRRKPWF
ncbi:MAG: hypothetical protein EBZ05_06885 [Verrucomicrobia bacterium]|nr:hypothetical protein [Verrucomicrobiota bacterium]